LTCLGHRFGKHGVPGGQLALHLEIQMYEISRDIRGRRDWDVSRTRGTFGLERSEEVMALLDFNVQELEAHLDSDVLKLVGHSAEVEENSSIPILRAVPGHK
jgi:hypothetical protein